MRSKRQLSQLVLGWFMLGLPLLISAAPTKITSIQLSGATLPAQMTIKLTAPAKPHIFTLAHPDRLVFDFVDTRLAVKLNTLHLTNPAIKSIRTGLPKPKVLRLVVDLDASLKDKLLTQLPAKEMTVALFAVSAQHKINKLALSQPVKHSQKIILAHGKSQQHGIAPNYPLPVLVNAKPVLATHAVAPKKEAASLPMNHPVTVMIDPGHGGKDTGAIGDLGTKEKDVVLMMAKQLADLINKQPRMRAVLTRNGDYYVTLHNRLVYARKNKADIYISIHADSYFNNHASGASVYALSKHGATSIAARWLARRDNYSALEGVSLSHLEDQSPLLRSVLIDLAQTATVRDSMRLGTALLDALDNVTVLHYSRVEQAPFMVLKSPDIPSILVETGFISNPAEELRLRDKAYQHKIAVALFNGIQVYQKKFAVAGI